MIKAESKHSEKIRTIISHTGIKTKQEDFWAKIAQFIDFYKLKNIKQSLFPTFKNGAALQRYGKKLTEFSKNVKSRA